MNASEILTAVHAGEDRNETWPPRTVQRGDQKWAAAGIETVRQSVASQTWRWPILEEDHRPDRVRLTLPMVSLLREESLSRLRTVLGEDLAGLNAREVQTLVLADIEGSVRNSRFQQFGTDPASHRTRLLQDLVAKGLLVKSRSGRWVTYQLSPRLGRSAPNGEGAPDTTPTSSGYNQGAPDITARTPDITTPAPDITTPAPAVTPEAAPEAPSHPRQAYQTNPDWSER